MIGFVARNWKYYSIEENQDDDDVSSQSVSYSNKRSKTVQDNKYSSLNDTTLILHSIIDQSNTGWDKLPQQMWDSLSISLEENFTLVLFFYHQEDFD